MNAKFIDEVRKLGGLSDEDQKLLADMRPAMERQAPAIVAAFYDNLQQNERAYEILNAEPGRVDRLKGHLTHWLYSLVEGNYGDDYFDKRYRIGHRHVEVGLEPRYVIAAMMWCRIKASELMSAEYADDPDAAHRMAALSKAMDLDLNIMLQSYDDKRVEQFLEVTGFSKVLFENMLSGGG
ncbi:MAG: hypothetical protein JXD18_07975 [Anaerolineae bacterium]|nr:hypothetical protein [Anaerolineae bacterium]